MKDYFLTFLLQSSVMNYKLFRVYYIKIVGATEPGELPSEEDGGVFGLCRHQRCEGSPSSGPGFPTSLITRPFQPHPLGSCTNNSAPQTYLQNLKFHLFSKKALYYYEVE